MRRSLQLASAALMVVAGCAAVLVVAGRHPASAMLRGSGRSEYWTAPSSRRTNRAAASGGFTITGAVGGLFPGATRQLVLFVMNPQQFPIVVTGIHTTVESPSRACPGSYLTVAAFSGRLRVGAGEVGAVAVPVSLGDAAPDACQGAVFPLVYGGSAVKADQ